MSDNNTIGVQQEMISKLIELNASLSNVLTNLNASLNPITENFNMSINWNSDTAAAACDSALNQLNQFQDEISNSSFSSRSSSSSLLPDSLTVANSSQWDNLLIIPGALSSLPIAAFQPSSEKIIESPLVPSCLEFESNYMLHPNVKTVLYKQIKTEETESIKLDDITESTSSTPQLPKTNQTSQKKRNFCKAFCGICHKSISRDMTRHLRTHNPVARFGCPFPHVYCRHRSGQFHRPYDFKKHLLNYHFKYDDPSVKKCPNLTSKLDHVGTCSCGLKSDANYWLKYHILTNDQSKRCPYLLTENSLQKNLLFNDLNNSDKNSS